LEKLKDIRAMENINIDFSIYIYSLLAFVILIVLIFILRYFLNRKKKKPNQAQISKKYLKSMDFKASSKEISYDFTIHASYCLNEKFEDEYHQIVQKLESFKYKKNVQELPSDLIADIKEYIKVRI